MTIGFALMLNNECHNFIRQLQLELHQEIGIGLARQAPHITIKSPFETDDIVPHRDYLEELADSMPSLTITFDGFASFGEKVIFLNVAENSPLYELHRNLLNEVQIRFGLRPHEFEGEQIKFHASIAGFNDEIQFRQAMLYLRSNYQPHFTFRVSTLGLFYYLGEGNGWIVNRRIEITRRA
ncbi:MAG: 2'-5' RNA ligase family protein [Saprospiraceae bacterium]